jgi:hypothetical protein
MALSAFKRGIALVLGLLFGERDSKAVESSGDRASRDVFISVLQELARRKQPSFATFEVMENRDVWFQVSGRELAVGNCPWPPGDKDVAEGFTRRGMASPPGFKVEYDESYENIRVITFECDPLAHKARADLIDGVFRQVNRLPGGYGVRGWVTRAE